MAMIPIVMHNDPIKVNKNLIPRQYTTHCWLLTLYIILIVRVGGEKSIFNIITTLHCALAHSI